MRRRKVLPDPIIQAVQVIAEALAEHEAEVRRVAASMDRKLEERGTG